MDTFAAARPLHFFNGFLLLGPQCHKVTNVPKNVFTLTSTVIRNFCEGCSLGLFCRWMSVRVHWWVCPTVRVRNSSYALTELFPETSVKETPQFISLEFHFIISLAAARQPCQQVNVNNSNATHCDCCLFCVRYSWLMNEFARFQS
jgi:hypothetical protein